MPETTAPEYELAYVDISSVDPVLGIMKKEPMIFENSPSRARRVVRDGDTIVSTVRTYLRAIAPIIKPEDNLIVSTGFAVIRPKPLDAGYTSNLLRAPYFVETIMSLSVGVSYPAINAPEIGSIRVPIPSCNEQQAIASYLDRKTAKIDALIDKKQELVKRLREKRSALISHTVTKGLDPKVKMKPSGVAWLGEVPEGWKTKPLKMVANIRYGIGEPPEYVEDGTPLIRATNVNAGKIEKANLVMVDPQDIPASRVVWLKTGDIIVVRSGAYTGDSTIIPSEFEGAIAGFDMVLRTSKLNSQFLSYILLSRYMKEGQLDLEKMRAAQPHLNAEELGNCFVLCPPLPEQQAIAEFLDQETGKLDTLVAKVEEAIKKLKEYRAALISAAVTGKIDVRDCSPVDSGGTA